VLSVDPHFHLFSMTQVFNNFNKVQTAFKHGKPYKNLCLSLCLTFKKNSQHSGSFGSIFLQYKAKCDADMLFFQVCHYICVPKLQMEYTSKKQDNTQQKYMVLQPYSKQEMTPRTPLSPHLVAEVCASSSNVIQKLFNHTRFQFLITK
jgi:hypothetical protein